MHLQYIEFVFKYFMKWDKLPNFPRLLKCAVSQDVRAYLISSIVIIGEACACVEKMLCLSERFLSICVL